MLKRTRRIKLATKRSNPWVGEFDAFDPGEIGNDVDRSKSLDLFGLVGFLYVFWAWADFGDRWALVVFDAGAFGFSIENGPGSTAFGFFIRHSTKPDIWSVTGGVTPSRWFALDPALQFDGQGRIWLAHWFQLLIYCVIWACGTFFIFRQRRARVKWEEHITASGGDIPPD